MCIADSGHFRIRRIRGTIIDTIAGNGQFRAVPDGSPAAQAFLYGPESIAFDQSGNLLISELSFDKLAQVRSDDGSIQIVAGNGVRGSGVVPGPASRPLIGDPRQIATDAQGSIYFVDSYNVALYKITTDGKLNRIAGQIFTRNYTGDNGPASNATFRYPLGVAVDSSGVIYVADSDSNVVRRIGMDGNITTYAGTGTAGFSGDNGPANAAQLSGPSQLAIDTNGNLLICDRDNNRIRQVASDGTITTVAGTGVGNTTGDGGPAVQANINSPFAIASDNAGGYYVVTSSAGRLRHVDSAGNISTIAGNGVALNQGDGGPAGQALLEADAVAVDSFGNVFLSSFNSDSIRVILSFKPSLYLTRESFASFPGSNVALTLVSGGAMSAPQSYSVAGGFTGIVFNASADQPWIVLANTQGTTPATMSFTVDPSALAAGSYKGKILLTRTGTTESFAEVVVSLNVVTSLPPKLTAQPQGMSLSAAIGETTSQSQTLQVSNAGSGTLNYQIFADGNGAKSLRFPTALLSGKVSAGSPLNIPIFVNTTGFAPGTYSATVLIQDTATKLGVNVPVSISIATKAQRMTLSQRGIGFTAVQGGGVTPSQNFAVVNAGRRLL